MANKNETTTTFNADISRLKSAFQEASRQIRLANSEFKAAASGMDDWGNSADGISAKLTQLDKVLSSQKEQLKSLEEQYRLVAREQGENSAGAQNLLIRINNQRAAVSDTENQIKSYNARLSDMQSGSDRTGSAADKLKESIQKQEQELSSLKDEYADTVLELDRESEAARELAAKIDSLSGELNENRNKLSEAESAADEFDNSLKDTSDGGINVFGIALGNLIANIVANAVSKLKELAVQSVEVGKNFDSAMSRVKAVSGAAAEDMELLRDKAKEMGANTAFSASEAADAMNYMAMAGWKTEDMLGGIEGIMNLAAASGEDLATTSDIVTDALTALGMTADESAHFADILASASSNANTNVSLMGESFRYVAPVAGSMGASAEDLSVALGLMANSGIKGSQAGNALKNSLVNLVKPTEAQIAAMESLGLMTTETIKTFDNDKIEKAQVKVENKTLDLEKAQIAYNDTLAKYGAESSQAQTKLLDLQKAENALSSAQNELTKAQEGTIETVSTGQSAFTDEYGNMKDLGEIMNILRENLGAVNVDLVDSEGNARDYDDIINELSQTEEGLTQAEQLKNAAIIFGKQNLSGMLAIINASQEDYDKLTEAIYGCEGAAESMADTMLDDLGGDMTLLKSQIEGVQIAIYENFEPALRKGVGALSKLVDAVSFVVKHSSVFTASLTAMGAAVGSYIAYTTALKVMTDGWKSLTVVTKAQAAAQAALNFVMSMNPIGIIIAAVAGLVAAFVVLWNKSEAFRDFWTGLWESVQETLYGFFEAWETGWNAVTDFVKSLWDGFIEAISAGWKMIADFFVKAGNSIKNTAVGIWTEIKNVWNSIPGWFSEKIITPVGNFFTGMWDSLKSGAKEAWEGIKSVFGTVADWFGEKFRTAWEKVKAVFSTGGKIFDGIKEGITNAFKTVVNAVIRGINKVVSIPFNAINSTLDKLRSVSIAGAEPFKNLISRFDVPQIPELARGGILKKGQIGLLEGNGAEAVLPLEKNTEGLKKIARLIADYIIPLEIPKPDIPEIGGKWLDEAADRISSGINAKSRTVHQTVHNSTVNNFNQTNNSPKSLSRLEIYRQSKNLLRMKG